MLAETFGGKFGGQFGGKFSGKFRGKFSSFNDLLINTSSFNLCFGC